MGRLVGVKSSRLGQFLSTWLHLLPPGGYPSEAGGGPGGNPIPLRDSSESSRLTNEVTSILDHILRGDRCIGKVRGPRSSDMSEVLYVH